MCKQHSPARRRHWPADFLWSSSANAGCAAWRIEHLQCQRSLPLCFPASRTRQAGRGGAQQQPILQGGITFKLSSAIFNFNNGWDTPFSLFSCQAASIIGKSVADPVAVIEVKACAIAHRVEISYQNANHPSRHWSESYRKDFTVDDRHRPQRAFLPTKLNELLLLRSDHYYLPED